MYEQPAIVVAVFGDQHKVVEEHSGGGRRYSLWGPDLNGRYCRMARYGDAGSAFRAARKITKEEGRAP